MDHRSSGRDSIGRFSFPFHSRATFFGLARSWSSQDIEPCNHDPRPFQAARAKNSTRDFCGAAADGDVAEVARLFISKADVDSREFDGRTALHLASFAGQLKVVEYLIQKLADVNSSDRRGNSPLGDAILNGHREVSTLLKPSGAQLSANCEADLNCKLCRLASVGNLTAFKVMPVCARVCMHVCTLCASFVRGDPARARV